VTIGGRTVDERDPRFRRRVAAMIGLPPLAADLTVGDHVALVASTWEANRSAVDAAAERVLDAFDLHTVASRFPHELSSGLTQLLGIALVFVRPFDVLLLDEPEQRLDPGRIDRVVQAMRVRRDEGAAIVVATHSSDVATRTADRTVTLTARA
jgi:ABC-type multidrug transport system ATPase subunit